LSNLQNWNGAVGTFSFTEDNDANVKIKIYVVKNKSIVEK
jgi:hypothetical protein